MELFSASNAVGMKSIRPLISIVRNERTNFNEHVTKVGQKGRTSLKPIESQDELIFTKFSNAENVNIDISRKVGLQPSVRASIGRGAPSGSAGSANIDIRG
jgi:hypothetical protein